jgi:phosphoribosylaminoimidazole (AIR) synthetase
MKKACDEGGFALLNGETAELGYRVPGVGKNRLNWNAGALSIINPEKITDGSKLKPGQIIVAFQETSIRSNGLTRARAILERAFLRRSGDYHEKINYIARRIKGKLTSDVALIDICEVLLAQEDGQRIVEDTQLPWHEMFPEITKKLQKPSTIYTPVLYRAQGGVDGKVEVPTIAHAHISGGGIPEKVKRMLAVKPGLGANIEMVFPDPQGIADIINLAEQYPNRDGVPLVDQRSACNQWNRGIGFLSVVDDMAIAKALVQMSNEMGRPAEIAGRITDKPVISWRGYDWPVAA